MIASVDARNINSTVQNGQFLVVISDCGSVLGQSKHWNKDCAQWIVLKLPDEFCKVLHEDTI